MTVLVCLALALLINLELYGEWAVQNAQETSSDENAVALGLAIKHHTEPDAVIGVVTAGAIPYFSERPAIDFLGKTDPMIARLQNHPGFAFQPGHSKWDIPLSVRTWKPDLIAQLWYEQSTGVDADLRRLGYVRVSGAVWVRRTTTRVDRVGLEAALP